MANSCIFHEDYYELHLRRFVERPWTLMEPLFIENVPSGLGTPDYYCTVERNGEPHFLVNIYGVSSFGAQALFWHSWLVIGSEFDVHFISLEKGREVTSFSVGYFCSICPTEDDLFIGSSSAVFCFNKEAQKRWQAQHVGLDGVKITSIQNEHVLGSGFFYTGKGEDGYEWIPFVLSLATGKVISSP